MTDPDGYNPMHHPDEQPVVQADTDDGMPKFGRLLLVLGAAVLLIALLVFVSEAFYA